MDIKLPPYVINTDTPTLPLSEVYDWGPKKLLIDKLHAKGIVGNRVRVGILDTGVSTHPDLEITSHQDFTGSGIQDDSGHGTHVAGIIASRINGQGMIGVAPGAEIHSYKVLNGNSGSMAWLANAIKKAADDGMQILNMSLGASFNAREVEAACQYAVSKGLILVAASGNAGTEKYFYPASYSHCYACGAINEAMQVSSFSNYGSQLEFVAPGEKILSTYRNGGYAVLSGTSMASPFATGAIALMLGAGLKLNYTTITRSVIDINDPNFDKLSGYGIIDPSVALQTSKAEVSVKDQIIDIITKLEELVHTL